MTGVTTLKALTLITKLYTGYAYSLAFIFQSGLVLLIAFVTTVSYILLKQRTSKPTPIRTCSTQAKAHASNNST